MVAAIDFNALVRDKATSVLAGHIRSRLAQTGQTLCKGSPESHARSIVARWGDGSALALLVLAQSDGFASHAQIASAAGISVDASQVFWRKTLCGLSVSVRAPDGEGSRKLRLFRRGHERFFSAEGVKLQLNTEMLAFALARFATESTLGVTAAFRQNYEGASAAQEADDSRDEAERETARQAMGRELSRDDVAAPKQAGLFR